MQPGQTGWCRRKADAEHRHARESGVEPPAEGTRDGQNQAEHADDRGEGMHPADRVPDELEHRGGEERDRERVARALQRPAPHELAHRPVLVGNGELHQIGERHP